MSIPEDDPIVMLRIHARCHAETLPGNPAPTGLEIATLIRAIANLYDTLAEQGHPKLPVSGPRFAILVHLRVAEQQGVSTGLTPTELSRMAVVSKNTISSLVKGLEADGYLRRELSPADKRVFRIHLTASGRELVSLCSPRRLERLNDLITDLAPTEQATLVDLLSRLVRSFSHNAGSKSQVDMSGMSVSGRGVSVSQPSPD